MRSESCAVWASQSTLFCMMIHFEKAIRTILPT